MNSTVSTCPCFADNTLILLRAAMNSVPNDIHTFSDILISRGSHISCSWQWNVHVGEIWELCGKHVLLPFPLISTLSTDMAGQPSLASWKRDGKVEQTAGIVVLTPLSCWIIAITFYLHLYYVRKTNSFLVRERASVAVGLTRWLMLWGRYLKEGTVGLVQVFPPTLILPIPQ